MTFKSLAFILGSGLILGCGGDSTPVTGLDTQPIPASQLVQTLDHIATSGEYEQIANNLSAELENEGFVGEAAAVQQFSTLKTDAEVKRFAKQLSASVKKKMNG